MTNFSDRTIWTGDNLDILRGLNSASVNLVFPDPPFNSNRNYAAPVGSAAAGAAFKDTWTLSDLDVAWMGLIADEQPAMYQVLHLPCRLLRPSLVPLRSHKDRMLSAQGRSTP